MDKVPTFAALFHAQEGLKIAALLDLQKKDQQKIENLYKQKLLQQNHVLTFSDFTNMKEADIEDMFEPDFYLELVNGAYVNELQKPLHLADLTKQHPRIIIRIEEYLRQNPLKTGSFDHLRRAWYFATYAMTFGAELNQAIDRFDKAFRTLNALL